MVKRSKLEKHKDVARIDQESKRTHGWYVRVRFQGKTHAKFFSDGKHGGRYSSLLAALAWRDQTEISLGKIRTDKHIVTVSNTKTGVVGVRHNEKLNRYEVSWVNQLGKQGKTSISIRRHGQEKAFELACQIRQEKEAERLGLKKPAATRRGRKPAVAPAAPKTPVMAAPAKKPAAKKSAAKAAPVKKAAARKAPAKVAPAKKAAAQKAPVKAAPAKKAAAKKSSVKAAPKKAAPKKAASKGKKAAR
ncbi:AP2 domain-containing protein [Desulfurivibrio sp. D14AmB]|uniref:AP2 domain-containing protein n=1 Tax=Desulfurivibrio sp. D14AmB TaxID=3374370 RepID=UPI00376F2321